MLGMFASNKVNAQKYFLVIIFFGNILTRFWWLCSVYLILILLICVLAYILLISLVYVIRVSKSQLSALLIFLLYVSFILSWFLLVFISCLQLSLAYFVFLFPAFGVGCLWHLFPTLFPSYYIYLVISFLILL